MVFLTQESVTNRHNIYVPHEPFTPSELSAMNYYGVLRPQFGPYYVETSTPDTAAQRAKSVRTAGEQLIEGDWTATMLTAAWIHLGGQSPEMFEAATAQYQRVRLRSAILPSAFRHIDYMQRDDVSDEDLLVIGGIVVTSVELTIEDLLRTGSTRHHYNRARELISLVSLKAIETRLARNQHLEGIDRAQHRLATLFASTDA